MAMIEASAEIVGVQIAHPEIISDSRGFFLETYRSSWFPKQAEMVQANRADRKANNLVGLHYHLHQSDYWYVPDGAIQVVLFDLRHSSPSQGALMEFRLGALENGEHCHDGVLIPPGVAHGFAALSDATLNYLVDRYYNPADELGVLWSDPDIAAPWQLARPNLSDRDMTNPKLNDIAPEQLPQYFSPTQ